MKRFVLFLSVLFLSVNLFAEQKLELSLMNYMPSSIADEKVEAQLIYSNSLQLANQNVIDYSAGINVNNSLVGATEYLSWKFTDAISSRNDYSFNIFFDQCLHWRYLYQVSNQLDFLIGPHFQFNLAKGWSIEVTTLYLLKIGFIDGMKKPVAANDGEAGFYFKKRFTPSFSGIFSLTSYDFFYIPKFLAPIWTLGVQYDISSQFYLSLDTKVRYIDMFTLTAYLDSFEIRLAFGVVL